MLELLQTIWDTVIWDILFRTPDPNLTYAIDPVITPMLISAGISALGGIAKGIGGRRKAKREKERQEGLEAQAAQQKAAAEKQFQQAQAARFKQKLKVGPEQQVGASFKKYLDESKRDPVAAMRRRQAAEQEATNIAALRSGGARALIGGLGRVTRAAAENRGKIEAESQARKQAALEKFAREEQRVGEANVRRKQTVADANVRDMQRLLGDQMSRAQDSGDAAALAEQRAQAGQFAADEQKRAANMGFLDTALGAAQAGVNIASAAGKFDGPSFTESSQTVADQVTAGDLGNNQGYELGDGSVLNPYIDPDAYGAYGGSYNVENRNEEGGKYPKLSKTPGPFSHATNPIHIMRNGRKIGEMTGGEVILNPDQEKKVASQSPYFRQLLRKFNRENNK
tara:strand:- start:46 stop:1236 length:1191 start_codon:yes stop_codon:yes gene_type:complete